MVLAHLACAHLGRGCAGRLGGATCGPHPPRPAPPGRSSPCPARSRPPPARSPANRIPTHGPCLEISRSHGHAWWVLHLPGESTCRTSHDAFGNLCCLGDGYINMPVTAAAVVCGHYARGCSREHACPMSMAGFRDCPTSMQRSVRSRWKSPVRVSSSTSASAAP